MRDAVLIALVLLSSNAALPAARAEDGAAAVVDEAGVHRERGAARLAERRFEDAIAEFRRAYEIEARPRFLFDIAHAWDQAGVGERAIFFYRRYLSAAPLDEPDREAAEARLAALGAAPARAANSDEGAGRDPGALPANVLVAAPTPASPLPLWRRSWPWAAAGGALLVGAIAAFVLVRREPGVPPTELGNARLF